MLKDRRPLYALTDPIVRFHHAVTRPDIARFEARDTRMAWRDADDRFRAHVLGPHFEHLARVWTGRFASAETTGGEVTRVGHARIACREHRIEHELDVVGVAGKRVVVIGEAKYTAKARTTADLARLEHVRELIGVPARGRIRLVLFAGRDGFDDDLHAAANRRDDVELVELDRLYHGD